MWQIDEKWKTLKNIKLKNATSENRLCISEKQLKVFC